MIRKPVLLALVAAFCFMTMGASSCGTTDTKTTADKPSTQSSSGGGNSGASGAGSAAGVGDSITLKGSGGLKMKVTVTRYQKHVSLGEFDQAEAGKKVVGVEMLMKNVSQTQYDDSPSNGAQLILDNDSQADATITVSGSCNLSASVKVAPGEQRRVCIPFEIGKRRQGKTFQLTLDSGFGQEAGEWKLR